MKKMISALLCIAVMIFAVACSENVMTPRMQESETGISITLPKGAGDKKYSVEESNNGDKTPKIEFTYSDCTAFATADKSEARNTDNYTNVLLDGYDYWYRQDEGEIAIYYSRDGVNYCYFIETEDVSVAKGFIAALHDILNPDGIFNGEASPRVEFVLGVWKNENSENYIRIRKNYTYIKSGEETAAKTIQFWRYSEEDTVALLDESGNVKSTLTIYNDDGKMALKSDDGSIYRSYDKALDGYYSCRLDSGCKMGENLVINELLDAWVPNSTVANLKVGDKLPVSVGAETITVESISDKTSSRVMFNSQMQLVFDGSKNAWKMMGSGIEIEESAGTAPLSENSLLSDRRCDVDHDSVFGCIKDSSMIYATVTVRGGKVTRTVVDSVFMG